MAQNYTRQSSFADGDTITASLFNNEYNQLVNAFAYSSTDASATGHRHDGSIGQGGNISQIGDLNFNNKIVVDDVNNRWGFFVEVAAASVEQIRLQDGSIIPVTTNDIDLGSASLQFKDAYFDGTVNADSLVLSSGATVTAILDEDAMTSNSATALATQQSIKAYVDAQVTAQDLDFQGDTGGALSIDLDSETLTIAGGTGIDTSGATNTLTVSIDSTVATLTGTQTLTNKTISASDITVGTGKTLDVSAGTLTLADNQISGDKVEGGTIASTTITSLASTTIDTTNLEVTNLKAKDGTAAGSIADTTGVVTLASSVLTTTDINGGTIDGTTIGGTTAAAGSFTTVSASGNITVGGTVDGRDVATDGTKLDGIEAGADVTDTANVTAAGALMDSELTNITAVKALNQGVATTDSPTFAGATLTTADINGGTIDGTVIGGSSAAAGSFTTISASGEITANGGVAFGDNDKATFGASDDLQIYHNGSHSYIDDNGTGYLYLRASDRLYLQNADSSASYATFLNGGAVTLYHNNSAKLATTSTGIDVTGAISADSADIAGTVTADGATVTGRITIQDATSPELRIVDGNNVNSDFLIYSPDGVNSLNIKAGSSQTDAFSIASGGDISFYEDTGTTAKFFWDASAESLGIGTSTVSDPLHIKGTRGIIRLEPTAVGGTTYRIRNGVNGGSEGGLSFYDVTNASTRLVIDSSGNVGINVTSPTGNLVVANTGGGGLNIGYNGTSVNYYDANEQIFRSGSYTERMRIDSSGNVGINTANVTNLLTIGLDSFASGAANTSGMYTDSTSKFLAMLSDGYTWNTRGGTERMRIDSSGNVGIGTSSPTNPLTVGGSTRGTVLINGTNGASPYLALDHTATTNGRRYVIYSGGVSAGEFNIYDATASANRFTIDSSGRVGIGASSPQDELHIEANYPQLRIASNLNVLGSNNLVATVDGYATNGLAWRIGRVFGSADMQISNERSSAITFATGGTERARIDSSGNVGIGTSSPHSFGVNQSGITISDGTGGCIRLKNDADSVNFDIENGGGAGINLNSVNAFPLKFSTSNTERMRIDSSGNLLVNTATTLTFGDAKLQVKGDTYVWGGTFESSSTSSGRGALSCVVQNTAAPFVRFQYGTSTVVGTITTNGSSTSYNTTSDYRLKENVQDMADASSRVMALKPCSFTWKSTGERVDGFLAHEAQAVVPEAVHGVKDEVDDEGNPVYQGIDQSKLVPLLTKALQEALERIAVLESKVGA